MSAERVHSLGRNEFIALMALMTSIVALSIDGMLPSLPAMGDEFGVESSNQLQLVVSVLFLGLGVGQLVYGPLSDVYGRKAPIYWGFAIFILGSLVAGLAGSLEILLLGRLLQGFGGAGPRIVSLALVRDEYAGNAMAQITSMVMTVFILIPAVAPSLGQFVLQFAGWRAIFAMLSVLAFVIAIWFGIRQPETLPKRKRKKLSWAQLSSSTRQTFSYPITVACMLVSGLIFGIFIGYLGSVQELFDKVYGVGERFPLFFGSLALAIGGASLFNARFVMALGMRKLVLTALFAMAVTSNIFAIYLSATQNGAPPLWFFMLYMLVTFFCVGFLFGNLNAMAMEPLGHVAGIGSAMLGFVQTAISVVVGVGLGRYFHGSVTPLVMSFGTISLICIAILFMEKRFRKISI